MSEGSGVAQTREQSTRTFFDRFAGRCADIVADGLADLMEHFATD